MRNSFICRQCLSRLRQTSLLLQRPLRAPFHTEAIEDSTPPHPWQRARDNHPPLSTRQGDRLLASERSEQSTNSGRLQKHELKRQTRRRKLPYENPATQLRAEILRSDRDLVRLKPDIAKAYGISLAAAAETVHQLQRLFQSCKPEDVGTVFDEYQAWKVEYSSLLGKLSESSQGALVHDPSSRSDAASDDNTSISSMKASWLQMDQAKRETLWSQMILSGFAANPSLLPAFLQATYSTDWSPSFVVEDSVRLLIQCRERFEQDEILDLVLFLLKDTPPGHLLFGQDVIGSLASSASLAKVVQLFEFFHARDIPIGPQTSLQLASRFAQSKNQKDLAAEILCSMSVEKGFDINSPAAASVCTTLLNPSETLEDQPSPDELFRMLLEAGLRPNLINSTALLKNFCMRGYLDTAWAVYDLLLRYNIEPDPVVYSTLLRASKKNLDTASINRVMSIVHSKKVWDAHIVNEFLDIILRDNENQSEKRRRQRKSNNAFRPMLQVYAKFFHLDPLQKLCSFPLEQYLLWRGPSPGKSTHITEIAAALMPQAESMLMKPDTVTLTLMLTATIRALPRHEKRYGTRPLLRHYQHIQQLLQSRDPLVLRIVEKHGTLIHDIFLRSMLQFKHCLQPAVHFVKNMLRLAAEEEQMYGRVIAHPRPSEHTWTILVNGFRNHRQPSSAASMIKMMREEGGLEPNIVTWNVLIAAFARNNNARGAVQAMRRMEQSGLEPDERTMQALGSMNTYARKQALALIEASKAQPAAPPISTTEASGDSHA
ncbi:hypothetical protein BX600DRAFT_459009 [Xylariales sp. PMI_506]|nr:hypothetical protein BX600DRAFT_459009 [Xylariales sp. PMI_506]